MNTFVKFFVNCAAQYIFEVANYMSDVRLNVLLAPIHGFGTSYKYIRAAQGAMERRGRIATVVFFMAMSGGATLTDPATNAAAGCTIARFIAHMKNVIATANNSTKGLVFANSAIFSKLTKDEFIVLNVVTISGVLLIVVSSYVLPRIAKAYWNYSKISANYILTFGEKYFLPFKKIPKIKKFLKQKNS